MGNYCLSKTVYYSNSALSICTKSGDNTPFKITIFNHDYNYQTSDKQLCTMTSNEMTLLPSESTFEFLLLTEINLIRTSPNEYANKIKSFIPYIKTQNGKTFLHFENKQKIIISENSKELFVTTIQLLNTITPMKALVWNNSLKIKFPPLTKTITNGLMERLMINKRKEYKDHYKNITFTLDIFSNPTLSALFQITDEMFKGDRREAILNPDFAYFAVNYKEESNGKFFSISTFA
jgi:hypothetical protein